MRESGNAGSPPRWSAERSLGAYHAKRSKGGQGEGREEVEAQTRRFHGADVLHGTMEWLASTVTETSGAVVVHANGVASGAPS